MSPLSRAFLTLLPVLASVVTATDTFLISPVAYPDLCLAPRRDSEGAALIVADCSDASAEFSYTSSGHLESISTSLCLDVTNGDEWDGNLVQVWGCFSDNTNQMFDFDGENIMWTGTDFCLDLKDGVGEVGTKVQIWSCVDNTNQQWTITEIEEVDGCEPETTASTATSATATISSAVTAEPTDAISVNSTATSTVDFNSTYVSATETFTANSSYETSFTATETSSTWSANATSMTVTETYTSNGTEITATETLTANSTDVTATETSTDASTATQTGIGGNLDAGGKSSSSASFSTMTSSSDIWNSTTTSSADTWESTSTSAAEQWNSTSSSAVSTSTSTSTKRHSHSSSTSTGYESYSTSTSSAYDSSTSTSSTDNWDSDSTSSSYTWDSTTTSSTDGYGSGSTSTSTAYYSEPTASSTAYDSSSSEPSSTSTSSAPLSTSTSTSGYLQTSGTSIVDSSGNTVVLKGTNLGGWLVLEDWMCGITDDTDSVGRFALETLESRFGDAETDTLIQTWQDNWLTSSDFADVVSLGFNFVRLPFSWRTLMWANETWREDPYARLDWAIEQAEANGLWVILDFHIWDTQQADYSEISENTDAGQSDRDRAAAIWTQVTTHYLGVSTIAAFDVINEPTGSYANNLQQDLYNAVRAVDADRIIAMESMSADPSEYGWTNVVYSLHEYTMMTDDVSSNEAAWAAGNAVSVADFLAFNIPVWIGEFYVYSGTLPWFLEQLNSQSLSWSSWTLKTVNMGGWGLYNFGSSVSVNVNTDSYDTILSVWSNLGSTTEQTEYTAIYRADVSATRKRDNVPAVVAQRDPVGSPRVGSTRRAPGGRHQGRSRRTVVHGSGSKRRQL